MKQSSIPTSNSDWGFFGTIRHHGDPDEAWPLAMEAIAAATACPLDAVRDFLDSRNGRGNVCGSAPRNLNHFRIRIATEYRHSVPHSSAAAATAATSSRASH